jgi:hypothetical protein
MPGSLTRLAQQKPANTACTDEVGLHVFEPFSWLEVDSDKKAFSRPAPSG